jgi:hypothetical protein
MSMVNVAGLGEKIGRRYCVIFGRSWREDIKDDASGTGKVADEQRGMLISNAAC